MKKALLIIFIFILLISILYACKPDSKYKTKGDWALDTNYVFAVEIDDYNGDIFQAGTYEFTTKVFDKHKIPAIYDIYISDKYYTRLNGLKESEFVGSVGGREDASIEITLTAGKYVYVKFNKVVGEKGNSLEFSLVK